MKIGLISDTHIPESTNELWPQVFTAFRDVDAILHAGDLHELFVVDQLSKLAPIYVSRGNGDDGSGGRTTVPEDERLKDTWEVQFGEISIGMTHYIPIPEMPPNLTVARWIDKLFAGRRPDVLIYGDTHVEAIDTIDGVLCVNPGSPTLPHNLSTQLGTIGFLEISGSKVDASIWQLTEDGIQPFDWENSRRPW
ncbi:MAG: metallophosphoesterase family protein [Pseudomonadales bacterium]|jgi:hypothetical protein|nr:metallophosphoesterase family protein [Pseudomonadales bacterium]MDP7593991.1 metallophosphoesterase family protein [Pseudomonadales bacterium]HJN48853.1 metallophosphoesterase family protein [Pseudomonadales bacterium]|tara:strand:+ start:621 stop:1202 length:582 start_codon:yes stop_codon:yes gene_type:complete